MNQDKAEIVLVYDKECPACDNYCRMVRIRESIGQLKIINARNASEFVDKITEKGLDIDQGMVLFLHGQMYYGADAIHALALISSRSGVFNRMNYWIFKSEKISRVFYPVLRFCRNILLKILCKTKINNLSIDGNDQF